MRFSCIFLVLLIISSINLCSTQQYRIDVIPSENNIHVKDLVTAVITIESPESLKSVNMSVVYPQEIVSGKIEVSGFFEKSIRIDDTEESIIRFKKTLDKKDMKFDKGIIRIPLKSGKEGTYNVTINDLILKNKNLDIVPLTGLPYSKYITWIAEREEEPVSVSVESPQVSVNVSAGYNKPIIYKYVDKTEIYKNDSIKVSLYVYNPFDKSTIFNINDDLTFLVSGFTIKNGTGTKNNHLEFSVKGKNSTLRALDTITYDKQGKTLILPSQVTFKNESNNEVTIFSSPEVIEVTVKNRPPEIKNLSCIHNTGWWPISAFYDLLGWNNMYTISAHCMDSDGYITNLNSASHREYIDQLWHQISKLESHIP